MTTYEDRFWTSSDGLKLHYRDYAGRDDRPPVICMHALTRNARDYSKLAERISGEWRVLVLEMRGRGESEYANDSSSYNPLQYVEDVKVLLNELGIDRFVSVGTSLGGLMTFILGMMEPDRIAGAVINDIGPYLEPEGLQRVKTYVGQGRNFPTWVHAARGLEESQGVAHPGFELADWLDMAKRLMTLSSNGRVVFDYDMKIAEPFEDFDENAQVDLWPGVDALAGKPVLVVRGALSDLFSDKVMREMLARLPDSEGVTIEQTGHTPTLAEPESVAAIERLLARIG